MQIYGSYPLQPQGYSLKRFKRCVENYCSKLSGMPPSLKKAIISSMFLTPLMSDRGLLRIAIV